MPNISALSTVSTAALSLSNLILVSPQTTVGYQPQSADGKSQQAPSILFHYEGEQTASLESDITDHYVEDNTAIQDQIALKPEIITTHGYIGELNNVTPAALQILKTLADKLTVIDAYTPGLSVTAMIAYNEAFSLYQTGANAINSAVSAWSSINGTGGENVIGSAGIEGNAFNPATGEIRNNQTKQQIAFQQFYGYWKSRTLFTVQTPWAIFKNMALKNVRAIQDAETRVITDFELSFKMMRFAATTENETTAQGRAITQSAGVVDLGTNTPTPSISMSTGLSQMGVP